MAHNISRAPHGSDASLSIGFMLCLALTLVAYVVMTMQLFNAQARVLIIIGLAFIQFVAQMFFFLHLGREPKPRWKLGMFIAMVFVVLVLVIGSIWIMHNLDYNMMNMSAHDKSVYMNQNEGL